MIRLLRKPDPERCVKRIREYVGRYPNGSVSMRIMLAEVLVELGRPSAGLEELKNLPDDQLSDAQRAAKAAIVRRAGKRPGGGLELE